MQSVAKNEFKKKIFIFCFIYYFFFFCILLFHLRPLGSTTNLNKIARDFIRVRFYFFFFMDCEGHSGSSRAGAAVAPASTLTPLLGGCLIYIA